ncbi:peptidoglycan-recognition protein LC-like [Ctenocephalides felis]|uniref:peptidoglycan-recognition protein LC-like n=1 Tax=Ctenocephalides felis TaxID=7515 RepID=UPI000E6E4C84|nr:peptidoglycan-recognition protein LC-like [Ctenocephalides felis]
MSVSPPQEDVHSENCVRSETCSDLESGSENDSTDSESDSSDCSEYKEQKFASEISNRPGCGTLKQSQQSGLVISQSSAPSAPSFGSIAVTNCADIHFGNKTYYKGPVTIKQFLYGSSPVDDAGALSNPGFERDKSDDANRTTDGSVHIPNGGAIRSETTPNPHNKGSQLVRELWEKWRMKERRKFIVLGGALFCTVLAFCLVVVFAVPPSATLPHNNNISRLSEDDNKNIPIKTEIGKSLLPGRTLRIISRQEWVAQPPEIPPDPLPTPVPYVIIMHTATENCSDQASCTFHVRFIQTFHMESRNWWDIGYNFLVGGDGAVYEGRGWDSEGSHTKGYNKISIGIAFIGTFNKIEPTPGQLEAAKKLIEEGVRLGKISPNYKLFGFRQFVASLSPGDALFQEIMTWPHWSNTTE